MNIISLKLNDIWYNPKSVYINFFNLLPPNCPSETDNAPAVHCAMNCGGMSVFCISIEQDWGKGLSIRASKDCCFEDATWQQLEELHLHPSKEYSVRHGSIPA